MFLRNQWRYTTPAALYAAAGGVVPDYEANFLTSSSLPAWLTLTRTGHAMMFDSTGNLTFAPNNVIQYSDDLSNAFWTKGGTASVTGTNQVNFPATTDEILLYGNSYLVAGGTYILSVTLSVPSGTGDTYIGFYDDTTGWTMESKNLTTTPTRFYIKYTIPVASTSDRRVYPASRFGYGSAATVIVEDILVERVTHQTTPSTYSATLATTSAAYFGPRFDYNPAIASVANGTGQRGLLIEESRTNLLTYSNTFSSWSVESATAGTATTGPDGVSGSASLYTVDASSNVHRIRPNSLADSATVKVFSMYIKPSGYTQFGFRDETSGGVVFTLSGAGTVNGYTNSIYIVWSDCKITDVGNGWYRVSVKATPQFSGVYRIGFAFCNGSWTTGDPLQTWTGDGASGAYIYGAQCEEGAFPTSYIPTTTGSVQRLADSVLFAGAAKTLLQGTDGSAVTEFYCPIANLQFGVIDAAPYGNIFSQIKWNDIAETYAGTTAFSTASFTAHQANARVATSWSGSGRSLVANAGTVATGSDNFSGITDIYVGKTVTNDYINGWIRGLSLYDARISDADLQTKSTVGGSY
jgi:hypothetical protein